MVQIAAISVLALFDLAHLVHDVFKGTVGQQTVGDGSVKCAKLEWAPITSRQPAVNGHDIAIRSGHPWRVIRPVGP